MNPKRFPFIDVSFAGVEPQIEIIDGTTSVVRNRVALPPLARQLAEHLWHYASTAGDRVFLAERYPETDPEFAHDKPWRELTYVEARQQVDAVASWLLQQNLKTTQPILILSENSIGHALLQLAATQIGIPVLPVSPNYALADADHRRLRWIAERFRPSLIYAEDERYRNAVDAIHQIAIDEAGAPPLVVMRHSRSAIPGAATLDNLTQTPTHSRLREACAAVDGATIAKIILTSGSTGLPKGVAISQSMMLAAAESFHSLWPFLAERPPVMVDWLPWNHTAGSNGTFNLILRSGGSLYIDDGRPTANGIARTCENLELKKPTLMFNVPRGYEYLVPELEKRPELNRSLLSDLDLLLYAGAGLSQDTWDRLECLAIHAREQRIPIVSSLGSTETASPATLSWWGSDDTGSIGLPIPGVEAKLIQRGDKTEVRFRGATVMQAYWHDAERSAAAFDEDGFFCIGDAVRWFDENDPTKGLRFDGRLAENFKLSSGIWVNVGTLRLELLAETAPWVDDLVIAGADRSSIGLLMFLNPTHLKQVHSEPVAAQALAVTALTRVLRDFNREQKGASRQIGRFVIESAPLDPSAGEITDKGYVAQARVLQNRINRVTQLFHPDPEPDVIVLR